MTYHENSIKLLFLLSIQLPNAISITNVHGFQSFPEFWQIEEIAIGLIFCPENRMNRLVHCPAFIHAQFEIKKNPDLAGLDQISNDNQIRVYSDSS